MKWYIYLKNHLILIGGLFGLFLVFSALTVFGAARRGDAPRCQEECLAEHTRQIQKLIKDLGEKKNRFEFQDAVDDAVRKYEHCVENCKEPQPVK